MFCGISQEIQQVYLLTNCMKCGHYGDFLKRTKKVIMPIFHPPSPPEVCVLDKKALLICYLECAVYEPRLLTCSYHNSKPVKDSHDVCCCQSPVPT